MCIKNSIGNNIDINNKSTILELYNFYEEELNLSSEENKKYIKQILEIEEPFYESLSDIKKKQFEDLMELKGLNVGVTDERIFIFAFSLAIRLIFESPKIANFM